MPTLPPTHPAANRSRHSGSVLSSVFAGIILGLPLITSAASLTVAQQDALFAQCAPNVAPETLRALVGVESSGNPLAIAVVGSASIPQPDTLQEAIASARALDASGANFSLGLMQVNKNNFAQFGLTVESAFDPCTNITAGAKILSACFQKAALQNPADPQTTLRAALSCYYSGNFSRGFKQEFSGSSYITRIEKAAFQKRGVQTIPAIQVVAETSNPHADTSRAGNTTPWDVFSDFKQ